MPRSILIVDDDESYGAFLSLLLRRHSFEAQHVTSARRALDLLQSIRFDALITDIYMPDVDGIELLRQLAHTHRDLPVLGMTGNDDLLPTLDRIFRHTGGVALMRKPVRVTEIIALLGSLPEQPN